MSQQEFCKVMKIDIGDKTCKINGDYNDEEDDSSIGSYDEDDDLLDLTDCAFPDGHRISDSGSVTDSSDMSDGLDVAGDEEDSVDFNSEDLTGSDLGDKLTDSYSDTINIADEEVRYLSHNKSWSKVAVQSSESISSASRSHDSNSRFIREKLEPFCFSSLFPDSKNLYLNFIKCNKTMLPEKVTRHMVWRCTKSTPTIIRDLARMAGFTLKERGGSWVSYWGKYPLGDQFKKLHAFQRINHFPASFHLGRKDSLCNNLMKMKRTFGRKEIDFYPTSFILPRDMGELKRHFNQSRYWIVKPPASARGIGIKVIRKLSQLPKRKPCVVSHYIDHPLLVQGRKFDIRLYVLVTSLLPLRIYLFPQGLVRFASCEYSHSKKHIKRSFVHLTNYTVNKKSHEYRENVHAELDDIGHKWSLEALERHLRELGVDWSPIMTKIHDLINKTILSSYSSMVTASKCNLGKSMNTCYELFGFDVLLDAEYQPWLMEVNISPSLHCASPLDLKVKSELVRDVANTVGYSVNLLIARASFIASRRKITGNVGKGLKSHHNKTAQLSHNAMMSLLDENTFGGDTAIASTSSSSVSSMYFPKRSLDASSIVAAGQVVKTFTEYEVKMLKQFEDEQTRLGQFIRLYPCNECEKYQPLFGSSFSENRLLEWWTQFPLDKRIDWLKGWKPATGLSSQLLALSGSKPVPQYPQVTTIVHSNGSHSKLAATNNSSKSDISVKPHPKVIVKARKAPLQRPVQVIKPKHLDTKVEDPTSTVPDNTRSRVSSARLARPPQHPRNFQGTIPSKSTSEIFAELLIGKPNGNRSLQINTSNDDQFIETYLQQLGLGESRPGSAIKQQRPSSSSTVDSYTRSHTKKFISQRTILEDYISRNLFLNRQSVNKVNLSANVRLSKSGGSVIKAAAPVRKETTARLNEALTRSISMKSSWPLQAKKDLTHALVHQSNATKATTATPRFYDSIASKTKFSFQSQPQG